MKLSTKKKYEIVILKEQGNTITNIARNMNISRESVYRWLERYETDEELERKIGSGRPKITTINEDTKVLDILKTNKNLKAASIKKKLNMRAYMCLKIQSLID